MRLKAIVLLIALLLVSGLVMPEPGRTEDSPLLEKIRSVLTSSTKDELEEYRKLLVELEKTKLQANDLVGATAAKLQIIKIDRELAAFEAADARSGKTSPTVADKAVADKAAAAKAVADKAAADKAVADKAVADKAVADKAVADKAAADKAVADKAAAAKAVADKAAAAKAVADKAAADKATAERAGILQAAAEKAAMARAAAESTAALKAAADQAAADQAVADKAVADKAVADKAAADKATAERAGILQAAAESAAALKAAADQAAADRAAADKVVADRAAADRVAADQAAADQAQSQAGLSRKATELEKELKKLVAQGNAKLSAGDLQGARETKKEISRVQAELDGLAAAGVASGKSSPGTKAGGAKGAATFSAEDLKNYRHILGAWERDKNRELAQPGASQEKVLEDYRRQLITLGDALLTVTNMGGASTVKDEITTVTLELNELHNPAPRLTTPAPVPAPIPAPAPPVATMPPPPAPAVTREPKTLVSTVQGLAGAPNFSEHNVYSFKLPEVGATTTLAFYITGRRSTDSVGNIWLITPDGQRERVGKWKNSFFSEPATGIKSYSKLKPITEDISAWVKTPGTYQVEFEWTGGIDPLVIFRVEITS